MRRFARAVLPVVAAAMMVLAGSSTAFAAAQPFSISLDKATDVSSSLTVAKTSRTTVTEGGLVDVQSKH